MIDLKLPVFLVVFLSCRDVRNSPAQDRARSASNPTIKCIVTAWMAVTAFWKKGRFPEDPGMRHPRNPFSMDSRLPVL